MARARQCPIIAGSSNVPTLLASLRTSAPSERGGRVAGAGGRERAGGVVSEPGGPAWPAPRRRRRRLDAIKVDSAVLCSETVESRSERERRWVCAVSKFGSEWA